MRRPSAVKIRFFFFFAYVDIISQRYTNELRGRCCSTGLSVQHLAAGAEGGLRTG